MSKYNDLSGSANFCDGADIIQIQIENDQITIRLADRGMSLTSLQTTFLHIMLEQAKKK